MANASNPNSVDVHVGERVRLRRKYLKISQTDLADAVGITFQQIQKYERAANRISASKLYEISRKLEVSIAYFFEGIDGQSSDPGVGPADIEAMDAYLVVPEIGLIPQLTRDQQIALGRVIAAMTGPKKS